MHRREFLMRSALAATGAATANVALAAAPMRRSPDLSTGAPDHVAFITTCDGLLPGPLLRQFGFMALFDCA